MKGANCNEVNRHYFQQAVLLCLLKALLLCWNICYYAACTCCVHVQNYAGI